MNTIKFHVSPDPTFARDVVPAVLQNDFHRFKRNGAFYTGDEKFIYLPGTETIPTAQYIRITKRPDHGSDEITLFAQRPVKKGSKATRPDNCDLEGLAVDIMLDNIRGRLRRKIMPAYRRWYANYQGIEDGRALFVECESVTECPSAMTGSYVTLHCEGKSAEAIAWMKRQLVAFVGAREAHEVTETFDVMLRRLESQFTWTHGRKAK